MLKAKPFLFIPNLCEKKHPPYDSHLGGNESLFLSQQEFLKMWLCGIFTPQHRGEVKLCEVFPASDNSNGFHQEPQHSTCESLCPDVIREGENI